MALRNRLKSSSTLSGPLTKHKSVLFFYTIALFFCASHDFILCDSPPRFGLLHFICVVARTRKRERERERKVKKNVHLVSGFEERRTRGRCRLTAPAIRGRYNGLEIPSITEFFYLVVPSFFGFHQIDSIRCAQFNRGVAEDTEL